MENPGVVFFCQILIFLQLKYNSKGYIHLILLQSWTNNTSPDKIVTGHCTNILYVWINKALISLCLEDPDKILTIYLSLCDINAMESSTFETLFLAEFCCQSVEAYDIDINTSSHHITQNQNLSLLYAIRPLEFEKENSILQVMCL